MRYAQSGGLTLERQAFRERLRLEAAESFAAGDDNALIARELRVHMRPVQRWYEAWSATTTNARDCVARRTLEGLKTRTSSAALKRFVAREAYHHLTSSFSPVEAKSPTA